MTDSGASCTRAKTHGHFLSNDSFSGPGAMINPQWLSGPKMFEPITKTCPYNIDLKPHFYIVKLGITGVYIIFLISAQNIDCGYSLELPLCFEQK